LIKRFTEQVPWKRIASSLHNPERRINTPGKQLNDRKYRAGLR